MPSDNYFGQSADKMIWYPGGARLITDQQVVLLRQKLMEDKTQQAAAAKMLDVNQQARRLQGSEDYAEYRQRRMVAEHRLARLIQLGMRQARYFGRAKTLFQLLMTVAVANFTLVAGKVGMTRKVTVGNHSWFSVLVLAAVSSGCWNGALISSRELPTLTTRTLPTYLLLTERGFRPHPRSQ